MSSERAGCGARQLFRPRPGNGAVTPLSGTTGRPLARVATAGIVPPLSLTVPDPRPQPGDPFEGGNGVADPVEVLTASARRELPSAKLRSIRFVVSRRSPVGASSFASVRPVRTQGAALICWFFASLRSASWPDLVATVRPLFPLSVPESRVPPPVPISWGGLGAGPPRAAGRRPRLSAPCTVVGAAKETRLLGPSAPVASSRYDSRCVFRRPGPRDHSPSMPISAATVRHILGRRFPAACALRSPSPGRPCRASSRSSPAARSRSVSEYSSQRSIIAQVLSTGRSCPVRAPGQAQAITRSGDDVFEIVTGRPRWNSPSSAGTCGAAFAGPVADPSRRLDQSSVCPVRRPQQLDLEAVNLLN